MATKEKAVAEAQLFGDNEDFSLVLGGPIFQLLRKAHLGGDHLELLQRRLIVITAVAWLPLCLLAALGAGGAGELSFFRDIEVHVRFLVALPVLIGAELLVHSRLRPVVRRFVERRIVPLEDLGRFQNAIASALKIRNSVPVELALLLAVYTLGLWRWDSRIAVVNPTWYAMPGGRWNLTGAGIWYVFISIPILQFVLLRWYVRLFIWFRFLWQVSRLNLNLIAVHPDRCGGLAFLGKSSYAFGPILFAQGAMLSGLIAARVLYGGENLLSFKMQAGAFVAFFVFVVLGPLLMFTPKLADARRRGLAAYGQLAQNYVEAFEKKWVDGNSVPAADFLGAADIQSLADLGASYDMVREMRPVPFGLDDITRLAAATAAPMLPLALTILSPEELIERVIKVVF